MIIKSSVRRILVKIKSGGLNFSKGSSVADVLVGAAIIVFVLLPVFSGVIEKYIILNKAQIIKDAVDMTNTAAYYAIEAENLSMNTVSMNSSSLVDIYSQFLSENLKLDYELCPLEDSIVKGEVSIDSIIIYTEGFPLTCPEGTRITRPSVHSSITVPVRPLLYRQIILNMLGKEYIKLKIHLDTEIPVNN